MKPKASARRRKIDAAGISVSDVTDNDDDDDDVVDVDDVEAMMIGDVETGWHLTITQI